MFASCKVIQESNAFRIPRCGFRKRISANGFRIHSSAAFRILDFNAHYSECHEQKFLGFWNPDYLTWGESVVICDFKASLGFRNFVGVDTLEVKRLNALRQCSEDKMRSTIKRVFICCWVIVVDWTEKKT